MKAFKKYGGFVVLLLSVVALIMMFLEGAVNAEVLGVNKPTTFTGFNIIFGKKQGNIELLKFNFLGFMALLLLAVGAILAFLPLSPAKIRLAAATVVLVLSAVFFFVFPGQISSIYKIGTPMILAGVFTILAASVSLIQLVISK